MNNEKMNNFGTLRVDYKLCKNSFFLLTYYIATAIIVNFQFSIISRLPLFSY